MFKLLLITLVFTTLPIAAMNRVAPASRSVMRSPGILIRNFSKMSHGDKTEIAKDYRYPEISAIRKLTETPHDNDDIESIWQKANEITCKDKEDTRFYYNCIFDTTLSDEAWMARLLLACGSLLANVNPSIVIGAYFTPNIFLHLKKYITDHEISGTSTKN